MLENLTSVSFIWQFEYVIDTIILSNHINNTDALTNVLNCKCLLFYVNFYFNILNQPFIFPTFIFFYWFYRFSWYVINITQKNINTYTKFSLYKIPKNRNIIFTKRLAKIFRTCVATTAYLCVRWIFFFYFLLPLACLVLHYAETSNSLHNTTD